MEANHTTQLTHTQQQAEHARATLTLQHTQQLELLQQQHAHTLATLTHVQTECEHAKNAALKIEHENKALQLQFTHTQENEAALRRDIAKMREHSKFDVLHRVLRMTCVNNENDENMKIIKNNDELTHMSEDDKIVYEEQLHTHIRMSLSSLTPSHPHTNTHTDTDTIVSTLTHHQSQQQREMLAAIEKLHDDFVCDMHAREQQLTHTHTAAYT